MTRIGQELIAGLKEAVEDTKSPTLRRTERIDRVVTTPQAKDLWEAAKMTESEATEAVAKFKEAYPKAAQFASASKERFVLCRRDIGDFGTVKYCGRPIKVPNQANWCGGCAERLPIWP